MARFASGFPLKSCGFAKKNAAASIGADGAAFQGRSGHSVSSIVVKPSPS